MAPIIKKVAPEAKVIVFSNRQHLDRIALIFRRYDIRITKKPSKLGYTSLAFQIFYRLFYEPVMFVATLLYLDGLISYWTHVRMRKTIV